MIPTSAAHTSKAQPLKRRGFLLVLGVLGLVVLIVVARLVSREEPTTAKPLEPAAVGVSPRPESRERAPVQVMKPQRHDVTYTLTLPANISPWYQATLYGKVPGYVKWMGFDKGDEVKEDELLAEIEAPEIKDKFEQARADHEIKRVTYERLASVYRDKPNVIAKQDVDVAEAAAKASKQAMESRRTLMNYMKIYAPFTGVITARFADPGALIQAATGSASQATPLYTIMNLDTVRVYVSIPQEDARLAKPGVPVVLTSSDMEHKEWKASITRTTRALDPTSRMLLAEIDLPNKEGELQPGMYVTATLSLLEHKQALVIPPEAIVSGANNGKKSVFVVEGNIAHRIPIKTGVDDGRWVEVVEGLTGTEDVVVVGKEGLSEGHPVVASSYNLPPGVPATQKY